MVASSQGSDFTKSSIKSESTAQRISFFQDQCDVGGWEGGEGSRRGERPGHAGSTPRDTLQFMVRSQLSAAQAASHRQASNVHCQVDELVYVEMNELLVLRTESLEHPACILQPDQAVEEVIKA